MQGKPRSRGGIACGGRGDGCGGGGGGCGASRRGGGGGGGVHGDGGGGDAPVTEVRRTELLRMLQG